MIRIKNNKYLEELPKITQQFSDIKILFTPKNFRHCLLQKIYYAKNRICLVSLYLENDDGGKNVMSALYSAKKKLPTLDISILVDFYRSQRGRIGNTTNITNAKWYYNINKNHENIIIPVYGIPVSIRETFGILHLKGFIIDDYVLYSGANINNDYLHQKDKYRYDRYYLIKNKQLTDTMFLWINQQIKSDKVVQRLDINKHIKKNSKYYVHKFRKKIRKINYQFYSNASNKELSVTPLIGLGKNSLLNKTIYNLFLSTKKKLIFCTPYFNLPNLLVNNIFILLKKGINIEIIIGDKTASDFYIPEVKPFKIISIIPYLYEVNLKKFIFRFQKYIDNKKLLIRLWKKEKNSFHIKGIWIDNKWILITGNNLTKRGWKLDLENGILIHDPCCKLLKECKKELYLIRNNTTCIKHFDELDNISDYPKKINKFIKHLKRISMDKIINQVL